MVTVATGVAIAAATMEAIVVAMRMMELHRRSIAGEPVSLEQLAAAKAGNKADVQAVLDAIADRQVDRSDE